MGEALGGLRMIRVVWVFLGTALLPSGLSIQLILGAHKPCLQVPLSASVLVMSLLLPTPAAISDCLHSFPKLQRDAQSPSWSAGIQAERITHRKRRARMKP